MGGVFSSRLSYEENLNSRNINNNSPVNANVDVELGQASNADNMSISLSSISSVLPQIYSTEIVKSLVNIHRDTIKFTRIDNPTLEEPTNSEEDNKRSESESSGNTNTKENQFDYESDDSTIIPVSITTSDNNENTTTTTTTTTTTPINKRLEGIYNLSFRFDSLEECIIDLFFGCTENDDLIKKRISSRAHIGPFRLPSGLNQEFTLNSQDYIDLSDYFESDILICNFEKSCFPVVISLKTVSFDASIDSMIESSSNTASNFVSLEKNPTASSGETLLRSQLTFLTLLRCNDKTYAIKPLKQKTFLSQKVYMVHDIYGIEAANEDSKECVACLNEYKEVLAIPCRHFCLCSKCADIIRTVSIKCPICRSPIRALLKIDLNQKKNTTAGNESLSIGNNSSQPVTN